MRERSAPMVDTPPHRGYLVEVQNLQSRHVAQNDEESSEACPLVELAYRYMETPHGRAQ